MEKKKRTIGQREVSREKRRRSEGGYRRRTGFE